LNTVAIATTGLKVCTAGAALAEDPPLAVGELVEDVVLVVLTGGQSTTPVSTVASNRQRHV